MRRKEKILTLSIVFALFFLSSQLSVNQVKSESLDLGENFVINASSPDGITINGDGDFVTYAVSGDGGSSTPWIIRDLDIDTSDLYALRIVDTTHHFEIRNCTLKSNNWGIYLDNVAGGTSRIENNTVYECNSVAIYLMDTNGSWIVDNNLIDNHRGISTYYCYVTHIIDNYLNNRDAGIFSRYSPYTSLSGNQMYGDGFEIDDDSVEDLLTIAVSTTTVNDKPLLFSKSAVGSIPSDDYGQIILVNGSSVVIDFQDIMDVDIGISLWYCKEVHVTDCTFDNVQVGVEMINAESCSVTSCSFFDGSDGVFLDDGYDNLIYLNTFEQLSNGVGISASNYTRVVANDFYNNSQEGAYFDGSHHSQIYWNNFTDNNNENIQAYDSDGSNNTWYNSVTQEGNYWDDFVSGTYPIDGDSGSEDLYPLSGPYILIPEFSFEMLGLWGLLISITFFLILIPYFRKRK